MNIHIVYFASLQDRLGSKSEAANLPADITTVGDVRHWLSQRATPWNEIFGSDGSKILAAVNQTMAKDDHLLAHGDEVAFFPPVTGG